MGYRKDSGVHGRTGLRPAGGFALYFRRRIAVGVAGLLFTLSAAGCGSLRVHQMQRRAAAGDDAWVAAQPVDCSTPARTCARLHLIKGNACLRLAESGTAPDTHYACAADALSSGIGLQPEWASLDEQLGARERLCEALDGLQHRQAESEAGRTRNRLFEAAQSLYQLAPGSVPAVYYIALARLRLLAPRLEAPTPADRLSVCARLKRTLNQVLSLMETADIEHQPDWARFADRYQRLAFELGSAMHAAGCH